MADKFYYWESNRFLRVFVKKEGDKGCELCPDENVRLSMGRPPPPLRDQPPPPKVPKLLKTPEEIQTEKDRPWDNFFTAPARFCQKIRDFKDWTESPTPPTPVKEKEPVFSKWAADLYRFDLQDIPETLKRLGMPKAAKMFEKWFAGELNYSPTNADSIKEINQRGAPYPPSMIDKESITLEWVLSFSRAEEGLDMLMKTLTTEICLKNIKAILLRHKDVFNISSAKICGDDLQKIHRKFQFQYARVEGTLSQKLEQYLTMEVTNFGIPDELTMILGSFNLYAAIAHANCRQDIDGRILATVTHIYVYAKDGFTFTDATEVSQYLGHWNRRGVAIVPLKQVSVMVKGGINWLDYPVVDGAGVLYPIKNSDFREWQLLNSQGGDYMIYTDKLSMRLAMPIRLYLS